MVGDLQKGAHGIPAEGPSAPPWGTHCPMAKGCWVCHPQPCAVLCLWGFPAVPVCPGELFSAWKQRVFTVTPLWCQRPRCSALSVHPATSSMNAYVLCHVLVGNQALAPLEQHVRTLMSVP